MYLARNVKSRELEEMQAGTLENGGFSKCSPCSDKKLKQRTLKTMYAAQKHAAVKNVDKY